MAEPYRVLSLFAGIGGFDLGLERTGGFKTVAFCEIEPFAVRVLNKHWPEVPVYGDVRELTAERLTADGIAVDVICGGFPCQDISVAGKGAGLSGERSGLWSEYARLIGELRPNFVIVENVTALLARGMDAVLGSLDALGYDAWWDCIPASAVGAHHRRDRIWIVAYPHGFGVRGVGRSGTSGTPRADGCEARQQWLRPHSEPGCQDLADAEGARLEGWLFCRNLRSAIAGLGQGSRPIAADWGSEPDVGRVAHGVPSRVDRLRCLGNAVVPQIPELIGRAILAADAERLAA